MANYATQCRNCGAYFSGNTATMLCYGCLEKELEQLRTSDTSKEQYIAETYSRAREAERELAVTQKALELACEQISEYALPSGTDDMRCKLIAGRQEIFLSQAKAGEK